MKKYITGLFMAWGNFFWIPTPSKKWDSSLKSYMISWLPTIGLLITVVWIAIYIGLLYFSIPYLVTCFVMTFVPFLFSGFMHVDGFMDVCDALGSKRDLETKQKILKDSNVGTFAVIKMIFLCLGYFSFMSYGVSVGIDPTHLALIAIIPRGTSGLFVMNAKPMEVSQYNEMEKHGLISMIIQMAIYIGLAFTFCAYYIQAALVLVFAALGTAIPILIAKKKLGGMNGDIAGYGIVFGELFGVIAFLFG